MNEDKQSEDRGDDTIVDDVEDQEAILAAAKGGDEADEADEADETKAVGIPKARFDEAVGKERAARQATEARLKEAEAKLKSQGEGMDEAQVEEAIAGLENSLDEALADGNKERAAGIRKEIRAKMMAMAEVSATRQAAMATANAIERVRYDAAVATLEAAHASMNPDHADYDEELTAELIELKGAYEATGMGSTDALKKAARYVFKEAPKAVAEEKPKDDEDKGKAAQAEATRKEAAVRKSLEAKGRQPAAVAAVGKNVKPGDALDATKMSDKEFDKLTDDDRARLRGDIL